MAYIKKTREIRQITKRQTEVLYEIAKFIHTNKLSPSFAELKKLINVKNANAASDHVDALHLKEYLTKEPNASRTMQLTDKANVLIAKEFDITKDILSSSIDYTPFVKAIQGKGRVSIINNTQCNKPITTRQESVLLQIWKFIDQYGFSPTYYDLKILISVKSENAVSDHVNNLKNKGYLSTSPNLCRSIKLTQKAHKLLNTVLMITEKNTSDIKYMARV
jgi:SOS-response transcriptional repressor LexA